MMEADVVVTLMALLKLIVAMLFLSFCVLNNGADDISRMLSYW